jgi:CheY-like chemotaxis protein
MQNGPVFIIDDDSDDQELVKDIWKELQVPNELCFFNQGQQVLDHLAKVNEPPFIILCDVNLPKMSGLELREQILNNGSKKFKSVPFIFWSTRASEEQIQQAYDLSAHGFFIKENTYSEMKKSFSTLLQYWRISKMPNKTSH